jgi:putative peptide zinc metalloprotease protein
MLVCSVSTLAINGNPLMRFDGYYILSNLIEVPNLAQKGRTVLIDELAARCLGLPRHSQGLLPQRRRGWFALYTVAATVYRWVVLLGILWFLSRLFKPYGLEIIGQALLLVVLGGLIGAPLVRLIGFFQVPGRMAQVKRMRLAMTGALIAMIVAAAWFVPLPARVFATVVIEPRDAQRVYVTAPGVLQEARVRPGDRVEAGQVLAVLTDRPGALEIVRLQGRCEGERLRLQSLERRRVLEPEAGAQIPVVRQELADLEERLRRRLADQDRLTLRSPRAGTVLPPAARPAPPQAGSELAEWSGDPLDPANLRSFLTSETLFCLIGEADHWEATLVIDQSDVELVAPGQTVELLLEPSPDRVLSGTIEEVAEIDLEFAPRQLSARLGGELQTRGDAAGRQRPASTSYLARVPLNGPAGVLMSGYRGQAKIHVAPQTVAQRLGRWVRGVFHFGS